MIREVLLAFIVLILLTSCGGQRNLSSKGYGPSEKVARQRVLIMGAGSVSSQIFMENLSENMAGRLKKEGVVSNYTFLPSIKQGAQFDKRVLDSLDYDAYLIFYPTDSASIKMGHPAKVGLSGVKNPYLMPNIIPYAPNVYKQMFSVQIYKKTGKTKPVWKEDYQVDFDLADKEKYNAISAYILNYLLLSLE